MVTTHVRNKTHHAIIHEDLSIAIFSMYINKKTNLIVCNNIMYHGFPLTLIKDVLANVVESGSADPILMPRGSGKQRFSEVFVMYCKEFGHPIPTMVVLSTPDDDGIVEVQSSSFTDSQKEAFIRLVRAQVPDCTYERAREVFVTHNMM